MTSLERLLRHPRLGRCRAMFTRDWWRYGSRREAARVLIIHGANLVARDG